MSENTNNTSANTTENTEASVSTFALGRNLAAEHPWFMGIGITAVATALSHFYYGNKLLTTSAWAFAGLVGGVALSKIASHAREIEAAARAATLMPANIVAIGCMLESKLQKQNEAINALRVEWEALKTAQATEAETQHGFRHWVGSEMAEARSHRAWEVHQTAEAKQMAAKAMGEFEKLSAVTAPKVAVAAPKVAVAAPAVAAPKVEPVIVVIETPKVAAPVVVETAPAVEVAPAPAAPAVGDKVIRKQPKAGKAA